MEKKFDENDLEIAKGLSEFKQESIEQLYDTMATKYENFMLDLGAPDVFAVANCVKNLWTKEKPIEETRIIDFGSGTGLVGQEMHKHGFRQIIGLDASKGMIIEAQKKNCYTTIQYLFLGKPETFPAQYHGAFNFVTANAILAEGHLGNEVFDEMLLSLKVGGHAVFTTRDEYLTKYGYGPYIERLVTDGKWEKVYDESFKKYDNIKDGETVGRYAPSLTRIFAYRKL